MCSIIATELKYFILPILFFILQGQSFASVGDSTRIDIFPLQHNLHYKYDYKRIYSMQGNNYIARDSGSIDLIVRDSLTYGDTLRVWQIEQRNQIFHFASVTHFQDSNAVQNDTTFFTVNESLLGNHLITIPKNTFYHNWIAGDCIGPWSNISADRFWLNDSAIQVVNGYYLLDSLQFKQSVGLISRARFTFWLGTSWWDDKVYIRQVASPTQVKTDKVGIPRKYYLSQNYPNPFNPSTKIVYTIPSMSHVQLCIYDLSGRIVAVLVDKVVSAGEYSVTFNSTELTSGVYFYRMRVGDFLDSRKMILLR